MSGRRPIAWDEARSVAGRRTPLPSRPIPLADAVGAVLAEGVVAVAPVPHYDSSAMDGWAVNGPPPWTLDGADGGPLPVGSARPVVTGGMIPSGTVGVVRAETGVVTAGSLEAPAPEPGAHIRRAGEEAVPGALLAAAGTRLSPAHVAMLAITGLDVVSARPRPTVGLVLTGDEVVGSGRPAPGRVRDAFDPLLPIALERLGGRVLGAVRVGDDPERIRAAVDAFGAADVVVTVGGTGRSSADRLREALGAAPIRFEGVAMRPGHPALLAELDAGPLLALPGNPLAAVAALLSFAPPLLDGLAGATPLPLGRARAGVGLPGRSGGVTLVPCRAGASGIVPSDGARPNMLRGLAASSVLAVVPAAGAAEGVEVEVLPLPW